MQVVASLAHLALGGADIDWEYAVSGGLPSNTTRPQDRVG